MSKTKPKVRAITGEHWQSVGTLTFKGATALMVEKIDDTHWKLMALVPKTTISFGPMPGTKAKKRRAVRP
jgi:hypothetical protein